MSAEVFQYPTGIREDIKSENNNRLGCWFTIILPFVAMTVFLIRHPKDTYDAIIALLATVEMIVIVLSLDAFLRYFGRKTCDLAKYEIRYTKDNILSQIDENKKEVASIDLNKVFKVHCSYSVTGRSIYSVYQKAENKKDNPPLQFSSRIRNLDRLLNDILKIKEKHNIQ